MFNPFYGLIQLHSGKLTLAGWNIPILIYIYICIMGVSKNRGNPKWMAYNGKPY